MAREEGRGAVGLSGGWGCSFHRGVAVEERHVDFVISYSKVVLN